MTGTGAATGTVEPVRWGFLGAGMVASAALAPAVHAAAGARLVAAASRDPARAAALGPERTFDSYEELLADPEVEAVYISLTNEAHLPWTLAAVRAGKRVLCEKPLGLTAAEVDRMAEAGSLVVEASWYRWHPRVRLAQQRLAEIGPVRHVAAGFTFRGPSGGYRLDLPRGGGALYDVGCYAVSACLWAVGHALPTDVAARSVLGPTGVDLDTRAILDWDDGAQAELHCSFDAGERQWLVITGERGEIELRPSPFTAWREPTELWLSDGSGTERVPFAAVDAYRIMVQEVSSVIRGGPGWVLPLEQSRRCAAVLDAIRDSAAH